MGQYRRTESPSAVTAHCVRAVSGLTQYRFIFVGVLSPICIRPFLLGISRGAPRIRVGDYELRMAIDTNVDGTRILAATFLIARDSPERLAKRVH